MKKSGSRGCIREQWLEFLLFGSELLQWPHKKCHFYPNSFHDFVKNFQKWHNLCHCRSSQSLYWIMQHFQWKISDHHSYFVGFHSIKVFELSGRVVFFSASHSSFLRQWDIDLEQEREIGNGTERERRAPHPFDFSCTTGSRTSWSI